LSNFASRIFLVTTKVKLGFKEILNKEQIGNTEPFPVTNLPVYLIICREKEIHCRNLFAERYIEAEFKDVPFKCKYLGCAVQLPMTDNDLTKHEKFCPHR
jgi:hypothetical protein